MRSWTEALPYFSRYELACKGSGIIKIDYRMAVTLPFLREAWGASLTPNSCCRTPEHNTKVGGHPNSLHLTENPKYKTAGSMAIDIQWRMWPREQQVNFARLAWSMGWSVGLNDGFIHLDRRLDLGLQQLVFKYGSYTGTITPQEVGMP